MAKTLRYSRQREAIYDHLAATDTHPSAEMIYTALRKRWPDLSLGTVYRNLKLLEELGRIRRVTVCQGNERYDAICRDHAHFICQTCGSISDLPGTDPAALRDQIFLEDGYRIAKLDMMITGHCPRCSKHVST